MDPTFTRIPSLNTLDYALWIGGCFFVIWIVIKRLWRLIRGKQKSSHQSKIVLCVFSSLILSGTPLPSHGSQADREKYYQGNYATAFNDLLPSAKAGDEWDQYLIGTMFSTGRGAILDFKKAAKWYKLAAEKGVPDARINLGILYASGLGVVRDDAMAYGLFDAALSDTEAQDAEDLNNIKKNIDIVLKTITPTQLKRGKQLSSKFYVRKKATDTLKCLKIDKAFDADIADYSDLYITNSEGLFFTSVDCNEAKRTFAFSACDSCPLFTAKVLRFKSTDVVCEGDRIFVKEDICRLGSFH